MHISVSVFSLDQPTPNPSKEGDRSVAEVSIDVRLPSWEGLGVGSGHELRMNNSPLKSHRFITSCTPSLAGYSYVMRWARPFVLVLDRWYERFNLTFRYKTDDFSYERATKRNRI